MVEELKEPATNLPRALLIGLGTVMVFYLSVNVAYLAVLSPEELIDSKAVAVVRLKVVPSMEYRDCTSLPSTGCGESASWSCSLHHPARSSLLFIRQPTDEFLFRREVYAAR